MLERDSYHVVAIDFSPHTQAMQTDQIDRMDAFQTDVGRSAYRGGDELPCFQCCKLKVCDGTATKEELTTFFLACLFLGGGLILWLLGTALKEDALSIIGYIFWALLALMIVLSLCGPLVRNGFALK